MKTTLFLALLPITSGLATSYEESDLWRFHDSRWLMFNFHYSGDAKDGEALYFNLTSDPTAEEPAVSVDCEIIRAQPYWQPCSMLIAKSTDWNRGVWVMPLPTTEEINIQIMHSFTVKYSDVHVFYNLVR